MMGFTEWVAFKTKRKTKEKNNERPASQADQQNGTVSHQGQAARNDPQIYTTDIYDFTQSRWQDYGRSD